MESLLRWSIQNTTPGSVPAAAPAAPRAPLDPGIIDHILGVPDSVLMRNALAAALDDAADEDARVAALDELEMLVEHIDNASGARAPTCAG
jgi:hsp70-interacting protein